MWTCPKCNKRFKTVSQYHSCYTFQINDHLNGKPDKIQEVTNRILEFCTLAPKYSFNVVKTGIMAKCDANFLSIYPTNKQVRIEFQLPYATNQFPVSFSQRISKNRVFTKVHLSEPEEVDEQIKKWIKESYELVTGIEFM